MFSPVSGVYAFILPLLELVLKINRIQPPDMSPNPCTPFLKLPIPTCTYSSQLQARSSRDTRAHILLLSRLRREVRQAPGDLGTVGSMISGPRHKILKLRVLRLSQLQHPRQRSPVEEREGHKLPSTEERGRQAAEGG